MFLCFESPFHLNPCSILSSAAVGRGQIRINHFGAWGAVTKLISSITFLTLHVLHLLSGSCLGAH